MPYDDQKIEDALLALITVVSNREPGHFWKNYDFDLMNILYEKGYITQPRSRKKSAHLTLEGQEKGLALAARLFGKDDN